MGSGVVGGQPPERRRTRSIGVALPFALVCAIVAASSGHALVTPAGSEFQVNTYTLRPQYEADVGTAANGDFVIVWQSGYSSGTNQDGSAGGIFAQRYASSGATVGTEFQVNSYTPGNQVSAQVAVAPDGAFLVVWEDMSGLDGNFSGIFGQRFTSNGTPAGGEFQINSSTFISQLDPAAAADSQGNFVVAWAGQPDSPATSVGVFGQRLASDGSAIGSEFQINTYTLRRQDTPAVATLATDDFVVVWESDAQDGSDYGVFGQRFASTGLRVGMEFQVNSYTDEAQSDPRIAATDAGFVVAWAGRDQDGDGTGIFGQRFAGNGARAGTEFQVNALTSGDQKSVDVAGQPGGGFVAVWTDSPSSAFPDVEGRQFASNGTPLTGDFRVNTYTPNEQSIPTIAAGSYGAFVIAWDSVRRDGQGRGVFAQRLSSAAPPATSPLPVLSPSALIVAALVSLVVGVRRLRRRVQ